MNKPITIGIDASRAAKRIRTGPENYSYEIIREILKQDPVNSYILYSPQKPYDAFPSRPNIEWRIIPQQHLWSQVRLARELRAQPPNVLFVPSHVVPILSHLPTVVTLHDLAFKYFPRSYSPFERRYHNFSTGISAAKAKHIIVPSQATKRDLLKFYPVAAGKVSVIGLGYDKAVFFPDKKSSSSPLANPYILYVGRIEEKKNLRLLIDAFVMFCKERKNVRLVLAGRNGYGFELIQEKIRRLNPEIRGLISQPGHLPHYDLIRYLHHATVFAFPSWYEGFGLSALEAMATGIPVVCTDNSSLPEVVDGAGILLPPTKPSGWAAAFSKIINDPIYASTLSEKGIKQANKFSWETSARETLKVITHAAKK